MAITNRYYDANLDMYFDSYEQHQRYMAQQYDMKRRMYEQQRAMSAQQKMYTPVGNGGVISAGNPFGPVGQETGTLLHKEDKNDPLAFLKKADNKLLLTGEM